MLSGEKIKKLRNEEGLSQEKLAQKLESMGIALKQETLSRIEAEARRLWDNELFALSRIPGVTVDYLSDDSKLYPPSNGDRLAEKPSPVEATKEKEDFLYGEVISKIVLKDIELWTGEGQKRIVRRSKKLLIESEGLSLFFGKKE
ncbi:MAG: helix-turn-helix transcriptional regulator [Candidatus Brocadiales bacterium]|nr:helix-turn-helix transcriptional regulator [Candidatus Brocadiales bacterium]